MDPKRRLALKKLVWFIAIYAGSLLAFTAFVYGLKALFKFIVGQ